MGKETKETMAATQKFSNSGLVVHTKLSPNHSGQRTQNIDQVAIHCVAGNASIESLGAWFALSSTQASANYGIGSDGRIGMYVEEKNRSWCTSSSAVDQRAVTIEVANYKTGEPWPVTDAAYSALIDLVTDICQRNNIKKLMWKADKSLLNQVDKQNMVAHRFTANKSCPGNDLFGKFSDIAAKVNARLGSNSATISDTTVANLTVDTNETYIWNFLIGKGLNAYAVAGIMGNLYAESGLISNNLQNTFEKTLNMSDDQYTSAVDKGTYKNFSTDKAGYGLAQWTFSTRKANLLAYAKKVGKSIGDRKMQCEFLWQEMQGYTKMMTTLKSAKSVKEASDVFLLEFERPQNQSASVQNTRASYGQNYYNRNASTAPSNAASSSATSKVPYFVRVTASTLNIRKGPGTNYGTNGAIKNKGVYTIVQESTGTGAKLWGKLKSGAGWISLDYCTKIN